MSEVSGEILEAFRLLLLNNTDAADEVSMSRADAIWERSLPSLVVYVAREEPTRFGSSPASYRVEATVAVEGFVASPGEIIPDAEIRRLLGQVKRIILSGMRTILDGVDGFWDFSGLGPTEIEFDGQGHSLLGQGRQLFQVAYLETPAEHDPAELVPYVTTGVEYDVAPADGTVEASDVITHPQQ